MCFIKLEALKPTYICTFDYVVLQCSVRHLAAASETSTSCTSMCLWAISTWRPKVYHCGGRGPKIEDKCSTQLPIFYGGCWGTLFIVVDFLT